MANYPYQITGDDNGTLLITFPDFPEATTFAETMDEAEARAQDAIETAILGRMSDREEIPAPPARARKYSVVLRFDTSIKIGLWNKMIKTGTTKAQLGRKLKLHPPQVERLFDPRHATKSDALENAAGVLGADISARVVERKRAAG